MKKSGEESYLLVDIDRINIIMGKMSSGIFCHQGQNVFVGILSVKIFCHCWAFCLHGHFVCKDILSLLGILYPWAFCPWAFCHYRAFCPRGHYVIQSSSSHSYYLRDNWSNIRSMVPSLSPILPSSKRINLSCFK